MSYEITGLGSSGEGIATDQGLKIFIDGALPGETVEAEIIVSKKNYAKASLTKILIPSPERVIPICPVFERCGGCQIMHLSYEGQLSVKREKVQEALKRIGKIETTVSSCVPSPSELHYRNKIQLPVVGNELGLYAKGSHDLVTFETCYIHCELGEKVYQAIKKSFPAPLLRHVLIKSATSEALITLVTRKDETKSLIPYAKKWMEEIPEIKGVVQNIQPETSNVILGNKETLIAGRPYIVETLANLTFHISSKSFFQVNPYQAPHLYQKAIEYAAPSPSDRIVDAYCGVGTLSLLFAPHAQSVLGIEIVPEAIADATANAERNGIKNVTFKVAAVEKSSLTQGDIVILNPPRKGCDPAVLKALVKSRPKKIVYVSCDPATLARDAALLSPAYTLVEATPFDMFPQTMHVETVALFVHN